MTLTETEKDVIRAGLEMVLGNHIACINVACEQGTDARDPSLVRLMRERAAAENLLQSKLVQPTKP